MQRSTGWPRRTSAVTALVLLVAAGCATQNAATVEPPAPSVPSEETSKGDGEAMKQGGHGAHHGHHAGGRHANDGGDLHHPFGDVSTYIAHLESSDRAAWQKPDDVVAALKLRGEEVIVDVGAGSGYFAFRFAKAVPRGRVIAADPEGKMIDFVNEVAKREAVTNLEGKLIAPDDPGVTQATDWVFICNVLHHVADQPAWLAKLYAEMKPGARIALIEFKEEPLPIGPPPEMKIPRAKLVAMLEKAGFALETEHRDVLPYQVYLVFRKPIERPEPRPNP